jgi:hypothetical protein
MLQIVVISICLDLVKSKQEALDFRMAGLFLLQLALQCALKIGRMWLACHLTYPIASPMTDS